MNLYKRPMFMQQGGAATPRLPTPMANMPMARAPSGAMPPMRPSNAPMAPAPRIPAAPSRPTAPPQPMAPSRPTAPDNQGIASMVADKAKADLATAQGPEQLINAFRGNQKPIAARYQELAEYVGPNDAGRTPTSVLTMVQPTIMMTEKGAADSGIGQLMAGVTDANAPVEGRMGAGIMQQAPVRMQDGGDPRMADFQNQQAFLQQALGLDADDLRRRARSRGIVQAGLQGLTRQPRLGESAAQQILPTIFEALGAGSEADMAVDQLMRQSVNAPAAQYALDQEQARKAAAAAAAVRAAELKDEMALEAYKKSMEPPVPDFRQFISSETGRPVSELIDVSTRAGLEKMQSLQMGFGKTAILKKAEDVTSSMADAEAPNLAYIVTRGTQIPIEGAPVFDLNKPGDFARAREYADRAGGIVVEGSQLQQTEAVDALPGTDTQTALSRTLDLVRQSDGMASPLLQDQLTKLLSDLTKQTLEAIPDPTAGPNAPPITRLVRQPLPSALQRSIQGLIDAGRLPTDILSDVPVQTGEGQGSGEGQPRPQPTPDDVNVNETVTIAGREIPVRYIEMSEGRPQRLLRALSDPSVDVFGSAEQIKGGLGSFTAFIADLPTLVGVDPFRGLRDIATGSPQERQVVAELGTINEQLVTNYIAARSGRPNQREIDEFRKLIPLPESGQELSVAISKYESLLNNLSEEIATASERAKVDQGAEFLSELDARLASAKLLEDVILGLKLAERRRGQGVTDSDVQAVFDQGRRDGRISSPGGTP